MNAKGIASEIARRYCVSPARGPVRAGPAQAFSFVRSLSRPRLIAYVRSFVRSLASQPLSAGVHFVRHNSCTGGAEEQPIKRVRGCIVPATLHVYRSKPVAAVFDQVPLAPSTWSRGGTRTRSARTSSPTMSRNRPLACMAYRDNSSLVRIHQPKLAQLQPSSFV